MAKRVIVLGASGIIGQHLMISVPDGVEAIFTNRHCASLFGKQWLRSDSDVSVIVNLTGESRPDIVEENPLQFVDINQNTPGYLAADCARNGQHYIHISTQAVKDPVNAYGRQKLEAEKVVRQRGGKNYSILRPTFVLGIRPFPGLGRTNPAERILAGKEEMSVYDRLFSISFAWDVAQAIWNAVQAGPSCDVLEIGQPESLSRWDVAKLLGYNPVRVSHDSLPGLAPRPMDTTYVNPWNQQELLEGISRLKYEYEIRESDGATRRRMELAAFLGIHETRVGSRLSLGFGPLHNDVTEDFKRCFPSGEAPSREALQRWYKETDAYLYELTSYHFDPGFNYEQMVFGIVTRLNAAGSKRVLVLGDGTGDVSLAVHDAGMQATYNDLSGSRTAEFAQARFIMRHGRDHQIGILNSFSMTPPLADCGERFDAIVSLDFLEHVTNVEEWVRSIHHALKPGGLFCAQNAFGMGSGPQGAMPMHLKENDRFEKDWDPLLTSVGFVQESSNWYRKQ